MAFAGMKTFPTPPSDSILTVTGSDATLSWIRNKDEASPAPAAAADFLVPAPVVDRFHGWYNYKLRIPAGSRIPQGFREKKPGGVMPRIQRDKKPWEMYILGIIILVLVIIGLALVVGPQGTLKEAMDDIKPQDKSKMDKKDVFADLKKMVAKAKPKDRKWSEMSEAERDRLASKVFKIVREKGLDTDISMKDTTRTVTEAWREGLANEKELPSDDPQERWKKLIGKKHENIRRIDMRDETGFLNCPQVDLFEDVQKTTSAGQLNHDEWVVLLAEEGSMSQIKRRKDKKTGWIESKFLRRVYTQEDIEKGGKLKTPKERGE
jgi:hypothetical protein